MILVISSLCCCHPSTQSKEKDLTKTSFFKKEPPESVGMNSEPLIQLLDFVKKENINLNSLVIARDNKIVLDAHFYPNKKEYLHDVASVTKSITSILIGIAIDKGFIKNENQKVLMDYMKDVDVEIKDWSYTQKKTL